ncbi:hypothetical protein M0R45_029893 [Rubus argutus]|uniref:Uncharacterized protein n=1 Tax=Rubus argutus TaxID=59490 RepID=A0AAW1W9E8_RUBAR
MPKSLAAVAATTSRLQALLSALQEKKIESRAGRKDVAIITTHHALTVLPNRLATQAASPLLLQTSCLSGEVLCTPGGIPPGEWKTLSVC